MIQRKILILLVVTFAVFLLVPQPQYSAAMTEQHDDAYYISLSAENKKLLNDLEGAIRAHDIRNAYALSDSDAFRSMVDEIPYPEWKGFVYFSPNGEAPVVVQRGSLNGSHTYSMDIFDGKDGEGCYLSGVQGGYVSYNLTIAQYSKGRANGAFQVLTIESEHSYSIAKTEGYTSDGLAYGCTKNTTKEGWVYYPYHFGWFDWWPDWPGMTLPPKPERGILNGIVIGIGTGMEPLGNRLGILLDGKEGVMWVDFYGRIDQFPVGTFVTVTDITTVAHAPTSPERFEINPVFPINLSPGIEVIVPKGFTLVFEQEANNAIQACFYDISGVFIVNKPLCIDKMTVRHGGVLTLNARLSSIGNAGHSEIVLENSSIVNGTYTWGLNQTKKGTHKFHLLDTVGDGITGEKHYGFWEYSYNTDGEWQGWNEIAQTNQAYYDRNNVKLDSEQAKNYFLDPLGSGYGIREQNNDPDIISLAKKITAGIEGEYDKALAIHDWVANNIAYDYDYYYNVFYNTEGEHKWDGIINCPFTSKEILALGHTVCGGYTSLTNDLLRSVGLPARTFVFPSAPHSRTEVYVGDRWLMMDVTWDSKNVWEQGKLAATAPCTHTWFDISADDIDEYIMHQRFHYLPR
ncbi:MAG: transglutaminase-like domain-containing protein, partial [Symbiobacteriaceae bacterium]|nr:transglutaminase-like domain-containing protein [Symbiobacteriaceae bacterium]